MSRSLRPPLPSVATSHRQRFQHPGRHGQRVRQPDRQPRPAAFDLPDGRAGLRQEHVPVEHRRPADLVHHPRQQGRLHRPQEGSRLPRRDEPGDGAAKTCCRSSRARRALRRAAQARARCATTSSSIRCRSTRSSAEVCKDAKLRRLVKNMIYDGVLSKLLNIDLAQMEHALQAAARQEGRRRSS